MKKLRILFICAIAFVFCSGFSMSGADTWQEYYENNKSTIGESIYCKYQTSNGKAGSIDWISFDATPYSLEMQFNEGQNLNSKGSIISNNDNNANSANNQIGGTCNQVFLYNYNLKEVCPANIYLYYFDAYGDGSYYTVYVVSNPSDMQNSGDYEGPVSYASGTPVTNKYDRAEDSVTTEGDISHANGTVTDGDGQDADPQEDIGYTDMDCYGLLGSPDSPNNPAYWLQKGLEIMRYAAIIALIGFSTSDFIVAISQQDQDALKKAINKTLKRFIYAIILFFVPVITEFIMNLFGVYGTCSL